MKVVLKISLLGYLTLFPLVTHGQLACLSFIKPKAPLVVRVKREVRLQIAAITKDLESKIRDPRTPLRHFEDLSPYFVRISTLRDLLTPYSLEALERNEPERNYGFSPKDIWLSPKSNRKKLFVALRRMNEFSPLMEELNRLEERIWLAPYRAAERWVHGLLPHVKKHYTLNEEFKYALAQAFLRSPLPTSKLIFEISNLATTISSLHKQLPIHISLVIAAYAIAQVKNPTAGWRGELLGRLSHIDSLQPWSLYDSSFVSAQSVSLTTSRIQSPLFKNREIEDLEFRLNMTPHFITGGTREGFESHRFAQTLHEAGLAKRDDVIGEALHLYDTLAYRDYALSFLAANTALDIIIQKHAPEYRIRIYRIFEFGESEARISFDAGL